MKKPITLRQRLYPPNAPSGRATMFRTLNRVMLCGALFCLPLSIGTRDMRAPLGLMLAVLGLPCQVLFGLLPAFYFVGKQRLTGAAKRSLLRPAIVGVVVWVLAAGIALVFGNGGC
ncbi:hypothetical protein [Gemmatimonas sp.]|uniref:hypothetical protein n=1 Tax=Gemmatimonas sp. TaxID=1962908 RepID=UPI003340BD51